MSRPSSVRAYTGPSGEGISSHEAERDEGVQILEQQAIVAEWRRVVEEREGHAAGSFRALRSST